MEKRPRGRPSKYTKEIANEVIERISRGETLSAICRSDHMPPATTVRQWYVDDVDGFNVKYARARDNQAEVWADDLLDEAAKATGDDFQAEKLRIDTKKWLMARNKPSRFGDKIQAEHSGSVAIEIGWADRQEDAGKVDEK